MTEEHFFSSRESMLAALQIRISETIIAAITEREQANLYVSGGSSPQPLYRALSEQDLEWAKVNIAMVDERWLHSEHSASNENFLRRNLLQAKAANANFYPLKNSAKTAALGLDRAEETYRALPSMVDLIILGMGPDGHTASLFPHAEGLCQGLCGRNLLASISAIPSLVTGAYTERISLGVQAILRAEEIIVLITGQEKLAAYKKALSSNDPFEMPIAAVLNQTKKHVHVYWAE